jgi:hypothetical protein
MIRPEHNLSLHGHDRGCIAPLWRRLYRIEGSESYSHLLKCHARNDDPSLSTVLSPLVSFRLLDFPGQISQVTAKTAAGPHFFQ